MKLENLNRIKAEVNRLNVKLDAAISRAELSNDEVKSCSKTKESASLKRAIAEFKNDLNELVKHGNN